MRIANMRTQRASLRILKVDQVADASVAKLDAYVAGGGIVHQSLLALQRAPIISNSRWRLQKICDLAQVVKVGGALMARCQVSDSLRHDMELSHDI